MFRQLPNGKCHSRGNISYNDIIGTLTLFSLCRPGTLSDNFQSEHVAAVEMVQTTILSET